MLFLTFQFCYAAISLQLEVGPIIIWLVVGGVAGLEDKWGDVVRSEKMCGPIIDAYLMAVKEEDLLIDLASSTGPNEENNCLHPAITINISRRRVLEYPVTGEVPVNILAVIFSLLNNHRWNEEPDISSGNDQISTP